MSLRYRINPEWRDAVYEMAYYGGGMTFEDKVYPLRFRQCDIDAALQLLQEHKIWALQDLAIKPLIIEKIDSSTAP